MWKTVNGNPDITPFSFLLPAEKYFERRKSRIEPVNRFVYVYLLAIHDCEAPCPTITGKAVRSHEALTYSPLAGLPINRRMTHLNRLRQELLINFWEVAWLGV